MSITITISSENPRSIRALEIAAGAASWIKCRTHDGRKLYAVPSRSTAGLYCHVSSNSPTNVQRIPHAGGGEQIGQMLIRGLPS
jgi:hypothetical protein